MRAKFKKVCRALNYFKYFFVFVSAVTGCRSTSSFASLVDIPVGITKSAVLLKICAINAGIKKCQLSRKKERRMIK